ncbi:MAG TPA: hypothetical protein VIN38_00225 [Thiobacillus sp.]
MADGYVTLRNFSASELIFDEAETRAILKFFFPNMQRRIDVETMTEPLRNFAQGLLVEAVDATYALGFIEILWKTFYNPGAGIKQALTKLGRKASRHWFKHASQKDLLNAEISSAVRAQLERSFRLTLSALFENVAKATQTQRTHIAYVSGVESLNPVRAKG